MIVRIVGEDSSFQRMMDQAVESGRRLERTAEATSRAENQLNESMRAGAAVTRAVENATERFARVHQEMSDLYNAGHISLETYNRTMAEYQDALPEVVEATRQAAEAEAQRQAVMARGDSLTSAMRTDAERYADQMSDLNNLLDEGAISTETYDRAAAQLQETLPENVALQQEQADAIARAAQVTESVATAQERYQDTMDELNQLLADGTITQETYDRAVRRTALTLSAVDQNAREFAQGLQSTGAAITAVGAIITGSLVLLGRSALESAKDFETTMTSFEAMLGSQQDAQKMLLRLRDFAAKTPFEMPTLLSATKMLLQFQVPAEKVMGILKAIGDVTGGSDPGKVQMMAYAFAQMSAAGRLMGGDLMQMINAGFNPLAEISKKTGKSLSELREEMSKGLITSDMVTAAFTSAGNRLNVMEKQSMTLAGRISTLNDEFKNLLMAIGERLLPIVGYLVDVQARLVSYLNATSPALKSMIAYTGIAVVAAVALTTGFAALITVAGTVVSAFLTMKAAIIALAISQGITVGTTNMLSTALTGLWVKAAPFLIIGAKVILIAAAIAAAVYLVYMAMEKLGILQPILDALGEGWETIKQAAMETWEEVSNFEVWDDLKQSLTEMGPPLRELAQMLLPFVTDEIKRLAEYLSKGIILAITLFSGAVSLANESLKVMLDLLRETVKLIPGLDKLKEFIWGGSGAPTPKQIEIKIEVETKNAEKRITELKDYAERVKKSLDEARLDGDAEGTQRFQEMLAKTDKQIVEMSDHLRQLGGGLSGMSKIELQFETDKATKKLDTFTQMLIIEEKRTSDIQKQLDVSKSVGDKQSTKELNKQLLDSKKTVTQINEEIRQTQKRLEAIEGAKPKLMAVEDVSHMKKELEEQLRSVGKTPMEAKLAELKFKGANEEQLDTLRPMVQELDQKKAVESAQEMVKGLGEEAKSWGQVGNAAKVAKMQRDFDKTFAGADEETRAVGQQDIDRATILLKEQEKHTVDEMIKSLNEQTVATRLSEAALEEHNLKTKQGIEITTEQRTALVASHKALKEATAEKSAAENVKALTQQLAVVGMNERAAIAYKMRLDGVSESIIQNTLALRQQVQERGLIHSLEEQIALLGLSEEAATAYKMQLEGLSTEAIVKITMLTKQKKMLEEAKQLTEKHMSPQLKLAKQKKALDEMFKAGAISAETYQKELKEIQEQADKTGKAIKGAATIDAADFGSAEALSRINDYLALRGGPELDAPTMLSPDSPDIKKAGENFAKTAWEKLRDISEDMWNAKKDAPREGRRPDMPQIPLGVEKVGERLDRDAEKHGPARHDAPRPSVPVHVKQPAKIATDRIDRSRRSSPVGSPNDRREMRRLTEETRRISEETRRLAPINVVRAKRGLEPLMPTSTFADRPKLSEDAKAAMKRTQENSPQVPLSQKAQEVMDRVASKSSAAKKSQDVATSPKDVQHVTTVEKMEHLKELLDQGKISQKAYDIRTEQEEWNLTQEERRITQTKEMEQLTKKLDDAVTIPVTTVPELPAFANNDPESEQWRQELMKPKAPEVTPQVTDAAKNLDPVVVNAPETVGVPEEVAEPEMVKTITQEERFELQKKRMAEAESAREKAEKIATNAGLSPEQVSEYGDNAFRDHERSTLSRLQMPPTEMQQVPQEIIDEVSLAPTTVQPPDQGMKEVLAPWAEDESLYEYQKRKAEFEKRKRGDISPEVVDAAGKSVALDLPSHLLDADEEAKQFESVSGGIGRAAQQMRFSQSSIPSEVTSPAESTPPKKGFFAGVKRAIQAASLIGAVGMSSPTEAATKAESVQLPEEVAKQVEQEKEADATRKRDHEVKMEHINKGLAEYNRVKAEAARLGFDDEQGHVTAQEAMYRSIKRSKQNEASTKVSEESEEMQQMATSITEETQKTVDQVTSKQSQAAVSQLVEDVQEVAATVAEKTEGVAPSVEIPTEVTDAAKTVADVTEQSQVPVQASLDEVRKKEAIALSTRLYKDALVRGGDSEENAKERIKGVSEVDTANLEGATSRESISKLQENRSDISVAALNTLQKRWDEEDAAKKAQDAARPIVDAQKSVVAKPLETVSHGTRQVTESAQSVTDAVSASPAMSPKLPDVSQPTIPEAVKSVASSVTEGVRPVRSRVLGKGERLAKERSEGYQTYMASEQSPEDEAKFQKIIDADETYQRQQKERKSPPVHLSEKTKSLMEKYDIPIPSDSNDVPGTVAQASSSVIPQAQAVADTLVPAEQTVTSAIPQDEKGVVSPVDTLSPILQEICQYTSGIPEILPALQRIEVAVQAVESPADVTQTVLREVTELDDVTATSQTVTRTADDVLGAVSGVTQAVGGIPTSLPDVSTVSQDVERSTSQVSNTLQSEDRTVREFAETIAQSVTASTRDVQTTIDEQSTASLSNATRDVSTERSDTDTSLVSEVSEAVKSVSSLSENVTDSITQALTTVEADNTRLVSDTATSQVDSSVISEDRTVEQVSETVASRSDSTTKSLSETSQVLSLVEQIVSGSISGVVSQIDRSAVTDQASVHTENVREASLNSVASASNEASRIEQTTATTSDATNQNSVVSRVTDLVSGGVSEGVHSATSQTTQDVRRVLTEMAESFSAVQERNTETESARETLQSSSSTVSTAQDISEQVGATFTATGITDSLETLRVSEQASQSLSEEVDNQRNVSVTERVVQEDDAPTQTDDRDWDKIIDRLDALVSISQRLLDKEPVVIEEAGLR